MTPNDYEILHSFFEEEPFEESTTEMYLNKQKFNNAFPSKLFGIDGKYFFPGTLDEASILVGVVGLFKDQKTLFSYHKFSPLLRDKIKDWTYGKLACSVLYYYLNSEISRSSINFQDWHMIAGLIHSPIINREVFCFLKFYNIMIFSSKYQVILGFRDWFTFPVSMINYRNLKPVEEMKVIYRSLKLVGVENFIIRDLIKKTFAEKNKDAILLFLHAFLLKHQ